MAASMPDLDGKVAILTRGQDIEPVPSPSRSDTSDGEPAVERPWRGGRR